MSGRAIEYSEIKDWYDLAALLDIPVNKLTYVLRDVGAHQSKKKVGKRTVYSSSHVLAPIQRKLALGLLNDVFEGLPDTEAAIAYRPGISPVKVIKDMTGYDMVITTDIKGYYDHIKYKHVVSVLTRCGFCREGASLIARYCCVHRDTFYTLQQGSAASPVLSNIVGHFYIDKPMEGALDILREAGLEVTYLRYCDNLAFFIKGSASRELTDRFRGKVAEILLEGGFKTHDWRFMTGNHPRCNQQFLGLVLNKKARVARTSTDVLRGALYRACLHGMSSLNEYAGIRAECTLQKAKYVPGALVKHVKASLSGSIAYINSVNEKHGTWLKKLYSVADEVTPLYVGDDRCSLVQGVMTSPEVRKAVGAYRNGAQSIHAYCENVKRVAEEEFKKINLTSC